MRLTLVLALVLATTFLTGCKESNPFGTVYVEGIVTLDGTPVAGCSVTLAPADGGMAAGGLTDTSGKFTVTTGGAPVGSGAKPGRYDVTFFKTKMEGSELSMEEAARQFGGRQPTMQYIVPQKYGNSKTSDIDPITVSAKKADNKFTFELLSQ